LSGIKKLAGETVIYGVPTIIGRILNWLLIFLYTREFASGEYGVVSNVYAYVAFFLVILTYGMETSFFRFAGKEKDHKIVYTTSLTSLFVTSISFVFLIFIFANDLAAWIEIPQNPEYIKWMGIAVAVDAFSAIPFASLRLKSKSVKFATLKFSGICINIFLNVFLIYLLPEYLKTAPDSFLKILYNEDIGIGYVFIANLISSLVILLFFIPDLIIKPFIFKKSVLFKMLSYGWPLLIVGVAGMVSQNIEKILIPKLLRGFADPMSELGVYAANFKLGVLMTLFIQAFRYSFEPFFFSTHKGEESKKVYADIMKYFIVFGLLIFLGVLLYIDLFKFIIDESYHEGLLILPWILMGNLLMGIYYNLSVWYKLTDKTRYGAKFAITGGIVTLVINLIFVPLFGYISSAIAFFIGPLIMVFISYFIGKKHFPVKYEIGRIFMYIIIAFFLYVIGSSMVFDNLIVHFTIRTILILLFLIIVFFFEKKRIKGIFKYG
jgi:O-antigen/teichoic acid export membrane protein